MEIYRQRPKNYQYRRVRTKPFIQTEEVECGSASLGVVLSFFGKWLSLEELNISCGISRHGSNAQEILKAARRFGLEAHGGKYEVEDLLQMEPPFILYWNHSHFLVLEGFSKNKVFLNDPAVGLREISYEEFRQSYSGIALHFKEGPYFEKNSRPVGFYALLLDKLKSISSSIYYLILLSCLMLIAQLFVPALVAYFFDRIFLLKYFETSWWFIGIFTCIIILNLMLNYLKLWILDRSCIKMSAVQSTQFMWQLLHLPIYYYMQHDPEEIASKLELNNEVAETLKKVLVNLINLFTILVSGLILFFYSPFICALCILATATVFFVLNYLFKLRRNAFGQLEAQDTTFTSKFIEALKNLENIKILGISHYIIEILGGLYAKIVNSNQRLLNTDILLTTLPILFQSLIAAMILGIGSWEILQGSFTVGMVVAMQLVTGLFFTPIFNLANLNRDIQTLRVGLQTLNNFYQAPIDKQFLDESKSKTISRPLGKLKGYVDVHGLSFGFDSSTPPLLKNIYLNLTPGKSIALVGLTGSGKSTLAKIIVGIYEAWEGEIFFDNIPRNQYPRKVLTNSIGYIEQNPYLFKDTVRNNLCMFDPTISESKIIQAAIDACIHESITVKKGGYDAIIEENGVNLSGGERQRMEIARVLVREPTILVLDEATSALDPQTEVQVMLNLKRRGCASLIIAHRLSTIENCDEILILEKGEIVAKGTHSELKEMQGLYRNQIEAEEIAT